MNKLRHYLSMVLAAVAGVSPAVADDTEKRPYMRVVEDDRERVALEVAVRSFQPGEGKAGPRVDLVGVAHIGEESFYRDLQELLDGYDVVLYESVLPTGARGASGEDDLERADSTRQAMQFVAGLVELHRAKRRVYPLDLDELNAFLAERDPRLAKWHANALTDGWGNAIRYTLELPVAEAIGQSPRFSLVSHGADGTPGGEGADADLTLSTSDRVPPLSMGGDDNLQSELASALGLEFQLDSIDYEAEHWIVSDMTIAEVDAALQERGLDIGLVEDSLMGGSLPMQLVRGLLRIIRLADVFLEGAIADTVKVALIEMLGDPTLVEASMKQLGAGFEEVIVGERNQVTMNDLKAVIEADDDVETVGIFYGAAHMHDFEVRLAEQLGYEHVPGDEAAHWFRAIEVDMRKSAVSKRELRQIRGMMRRMMGQ